MNREALLGSFLEISEDHEKPLSSVLPDMIERQGRLSAWQVLVHAVGRMMNLSLPHCESFLKSCPNDTLATKELEKEQPNYSQYFLPLPLPSPGSPNRPSTHYAPCCSALRHTS